MSNENDIEFKFTPKKKRDKKKKDNAFSVLQKLKV